MPIIILEGIDGGGKSTLATLIQAKSPWPKTTVVHKGPIKTNVIEELITPILEVKPDGLLIADRWHLSELIYGPIYRGKSQIDLEVLNEIETVLTHMKAVRAVVSPPLYQIEKRLLARGEDFLQPQHTALVHYAYQGLAEAHGYERLRYTDEHVALRLLAAAR